MCVCVRVCMCTHKHPKYHLTSRQKKAGLDDVTCCTDTFQTDFVLHSCAGVTRRWGQ